MDDHRIHPVEHQTPAWANLAHREGVKLDVEGREKPIEDNGHDRCGSDRWQ